MRELRNLELDRLRGLAVILTVLIHYTRIFFPWSVHPDYHHGGSIFNIWMNSWTGVDLFFVISGYIISKKLVESVDNAQRNAFLLVNSVKTFYLKRFFRIYPACITVFLIVFLCSIFVNKSGSFGSVENTIEAGISIFTYTFNYYFAFGSYHAFPLSQYWSLSVEEQFYLLYPFLLILLKTNKQRVYFLIGTLIVITFYIRPYSSLQSLFLTQTRCDGLIYGCLLYFLSMNKWYKSLAPKVLKNKSVSIIVFSVLAIILAAFPGLGFSNNINIPLACVLSTILVMLSSFEKNIIISFSFIQVLLDYLGKRSYTLYLVHLTMFSLTQEIFFRLSSAYDFPIKHGLGLYYSVTALLLTIISTEFIYHFVEKPLIGKGRRIIKKLNRNKELEEMHNQPTSIIVN